MNGVTTPQQASVRVELEELPGGVGLAAAVGEGGLLTLLLNPQATPERIRDDLAGVLGHLTGSGLLGWTSGPQQLGLP
ncbi:hypothetical protein [Streptomyces sp. NPDC057854]|uniref:hypothetical protein n=1 Tax=unclassified Streptomyces TaxID=2593676 RepID=UPI003680B2AB